MKKKFISNFSIVPISLLLFFAACTKQSDPVSDQNTGNSENQGNNENSDAYKFSNPQNISLIPIQYYTQRSFITANHVYHRISSNVDYMAFSKDQMIGNFGFGFPGVPHQINVRPISAETGPFCIDKDEQYMYIVSAFHLYKCNLSVPQSDGVPLTAASVNLGTCMALKAKDNGDILFSTDLENGSIQIVRSGSSTPDIIVSNLGATPDAIDVLNNEIYFTLDLNNGSVKKISSAGSISTVVDNLTHPSRLAFDNNENFILETQITSDGNNYGQYTIYSRSGNKIMDITDNKGSLILSALGTEEMVPLCVDINNNLYFGHRDGWGNSLANRCNPFVNGNGTPNIYKVQLVKQ